MKVVTPLCLQFVYLIDRCVKPSVQCTSGNPRYLTSNTTLTDENVAYLRNPDIHLKILTLFKYTVVILDVKLWQKSPKTSNCLNVVVPCDHVIDIHVAAVNSKPTPFYDKSYKTRKMCMSSLTYYLFNLLEPFTTYLTFTDANRHFYNGCIDWKQKWSPKYSIIFWMSITLCHVVNKVTKTPSEYF